MNIDMRPIGTWFVVFLILAAGCVVSVGSFLVGTMAGSRECNSIDVPYQIYPGLTINCKGAGMTDCDTIYTYSKVW